MFSQKLTVNDTLDYILNDDSDFVDLEIDSYFDEIDAIENNSDEVEANVIIDDNELHNLEKKLMIMNYITWMKMGTLVFHETLTNLYQLYLRHLKM